MYICKVCKRTQFSFSIKCMHCASILSLEEVKQTAKFLKLEEIETPETIKFKTPLDENLGGPLPAGSMTILAGVPGAGKSTLALEIANQILNNPSNSSLLTPDFLLLYISSEEPPELIKARAMRVAPELVKNENFLLLCETNLELIKNSISSLITSNSPQITPYSSLFIILDSINAVKSSKTNSAPGSPSNIIKTLNMLHILRTRHTYSSPPTPYYSPFTVHYSPLTILIIAHANKQRTIAGPLTLQHMVDIVLFFDIEKDESRTLTTLKNRFGPSGIKVKFNLHNSP